MHEINLIFAWCWILAGLLTGAVQGLGFHREEWMGGYDSWRRRLARLGHIAFLGTAMINLAFAFTVPAMGMAEDAWLQWCSILLIVGAVSMPTVCYLSAWRKGFRHLFAVPVLSLVVGVALFACLLVLRALPNSTEGVGG